MKRVTKKQSSQARNFANKLLKELQKELKLKYKFTTKLVGSAKYNTILKMRMVGLMLIIKLF